MVWGGVSNLLTDHFFQAKRFPKSLVPGMRFLFPDGFICKWGLNHDPVYTDGGTLCTFPKRQISYSLFSISFLFFFRIAVQLPNLTDHCFAGKLTFWWEMFTENHLQASPHHLSLFHFYDKAGYMPAQKHPCLNLSSNLKLRR